MLLLSGVIEASESPRITDERFLDLRAKYSLVSWQFDERGVPELLKGKLAGPEDRVPPMEAFYRFLDENRDLFGMTDPRTELALYGEEEDSYSGYHLRFRQSYHGLTVYGMELLAHFDPTGTLVSVNGHYIPDIAISPAPTVDEHHARDLALHDERITDTNATVSACELVVFPFGDVVRLAWLIDVSGIPGSGVQFGIDANTGEIFRAVPTFQSTSVKGGVNRKVEESPPRTTDSKRVSPAAETGQGESRHGTMKYIPNPERENPDSADGRSVHELDALDAIRVPKMTPLDDSERPPHPLSNRESSEGEPSPPPGKADKKSIGPKKPDTAIAMNNEIHGRCRPRLNFKIPMFVSAGFHPSYLAQ